MTVDEETLRRLFQESTGRASPGENRECPPTETLVDAAAPGRSALPTTLLDHLAACRDCAQEFQVLRDVARWAERAGGAKRPRTRPAGQWAGGRLWTSVAAAAVLLVLFPFVRETVVPAGRYRAPAAETIRALVDENRPVSREVAILRWSSPGAGSIYQLTIVREDLTVLHTAEGLTATEYAVPPSVLASVPEGNRVFWRVEARVPGGRTVASSVFVLHLE
jgi:hypothetical protein